MAMADIQAVGGDDVELALVVLRRLELQDRQLAELRAANERLEAELEPIRALAVILRQAGDAVANAAEDVSRPGGQPPWPCV